MTCKGAGPSLKLCGENKAAVKPSLRGGSPIGPVKTVCHSEVQISETETPLYRLETIYRRMNETAHDGRKPLGSLRNIIEGWFYTLERDVLAEEESTENDHAQILARTNELLEKD